MNFKGLQRKETLVSLLMMSFIWVAITVGNAIIGYLYRPAMPGERISFWLSSLVGLLQFVILSVGAIVAVSLLNKKVHREKYFLSALFTWLSFSKILAYPSAAVRVFTQLGGQTNQAILTGTFVVIQLLLVYVLTMIISRLILGTTEQAD